MNWNKQDIKNICKIVAFGVVLYWALNNLSLLGGAFSSLMSILSPFIIGIAIAFVINIPMTIFEKRVFVKKKKRKAQKISKFKRFMCILLSFVIIILIIVGVTFLVIPEIASAIGEMISYLPEVFSNAESWASDLVTEYPEISGGLESFQSSLDNVKTDIIKQLTSIGTNFLTSSLNFVTSTIGTVVKVVIAIIFAIYVLMDKEKIYIQLKRVVYAFLNEKVADKIYEIASVSRAAFNNFITGQFTECILLGTLCAIGMVILRLPYSATVGVLVAITAFIPIVGAFIGGFVGVLLILPVSWVKAVIFLIFFIILQQTENNLIYPKRVGGKVGIPGFLALVAVTIGGSLWGAIGMLVSLPVASVVCTLIREATNKRLKIKDIDVENNNFNEKSTRKEDV